MLPIPSANIAIKRYELRWNDAEGASFDKVRKACNKVDEINRHHQPLPNDSGESTGQTPGSPGRGKRASERKAGDTGAASGYARIT